MDEPPHSQPQTQTQTQSQTPQPEAPRGLLLTPSVAQRLAGFLATLEGVEVLVAPEGEGETLTEEQLARVRGAFFLNEESRAPRRLLGIARRAPDLEWMHLGHAGSDAPAFQEMMERGVAVTTSSGVQAEPIAQTVIGALLSLNRGFVGWADAQRRRVWDQRVDRAPRDLRGQTMVVLGLGAIGGYVARFARAFGMHVVGVRRSPVDVQDASHGLDEWASPDRLAEVLPRADVLVVTLPLTSNTRGLLDAATLDLLPHGATFINVSRGKIVDEEALIERLRDGRLGGAYLDVFQQEPLPEASPLWDLPNVIVSPHDAGRSAGNMARVDAVFQEEALRWLRGEDSPRRVRER